MKVEILSPYMDMELKRTVKPGEVIEVSKSRAKRLVTLKLAEYLPKPTKKKVSTKAKAKRSRK